METRARSKIPTAENRRKNREIGIFHNFAEAEMRFEKRKSWRKFALQMYEFWGEMVVEKRKKNQKIEKKTAPKFQV